MNPCVSAVLPSLQLRSMASGGGLLPTYQQQKYVNGVPISTVGRRTLRLREKYILLLVISVFAFVCFGAILFMPDMRDRVVSADGQIGPVDIGDMFVPRLHAAGIQNRHGQGSRRDPHDINDARVFRDLVQQAPHRQAIVDLPRPQGFLSSSVVGVNVAEEQVDADRRSAKHQNDSVKDGRIINIPSNVYHMDNVTRERQAKVKEVVFLHLKMCLASNTRKPCYRKENRAMRPIYGCPEKFRESLATLTATFPEIVNGLLL